MISATTDTTKLNDRLNALHDALIGAGQYSDANDLLRGEAARLNMQIVKMTPPLGPGGGNAGAKKAGEQAIEKEMKSLFSEASYTLIDEVGSKHGISNINAFLEGKDKTPIHLQWDNLDPTGARMAEYHRRYQNRSGKVKLQRQTKGTWKSRVVVPEGARADYIRQLKTRVGRWRASFATALPMLGKNVPSWISRHFGSVSSIAVLDISQLNHPTKPAIMFGTRAPGCGDQQYQARIRRAVEIRTKAMGNRCRLILSGYARDISQGMRPRKRARETDTEPQEVLE